MVLLLLKSYSKKISWVVLYLPTYSVYMVVHRWLCLIGIILLFQCLFSDKKNVFSIYVVSELSFEFFIEENILKLIYHNILQKVKNVLFALIGMENVLILEQGFVLLWASQASVFSGMGLLPGMLAELLIFVVSNE